MRSTSLITPSLMIFPVYIEVPSTPILPICMAKSLGIPTLPPVGGRVDMSLNNRGLLVRVQTRKHSSPDPEGDNDAADHAFHAKELRRLGLGEQEDNADHEQPDERGDPPLAVVIEELPDLHPSAMGNTKRPADNNGDEGVREDIELGLFPRFEFHSINPSMSF